MILVFRVLFVVFFIVLGYLSEFQWLFPFQLPYGAWIGAGIGLFFALLVLLIDAFFKRFTVRNLLSILLGIALGLLVHRLFMNVMYHAQISEVILHQIGVLSAVMFSYLGAVTILRGQDEFNLLIPFIKLESKGPGEEIILLDTSVIIDGRIADIAETHFLSGRLVLPRFVLKELQLIADSSDPLKRNRGRRGLDILNRIKKNPHLDVKIHEMDFPEFSTVDAKLVKMAQVIGAKVFTNDYNLNKVAELQGVKVLNINELANAVKPVVMPGETMQVKVLKEGKEHDQGVAYLNDGTMVVVDNGRRRIGQTVNVIITSVLQTQAGRMIFAKLAESEEPASGPRGR